MPLNISKCTLISFSRRRVSVLYDYSIDGSLLARLDRVKDLGVTFNTCLSFVDHIGSIVNKANAILGFVKRWSK